MPEKEAKTEHSCYHKEKCGDRNDDKFSKFDNDLFVTHTEYLWTCLFCAQKICFYLILFESQVAKANSLSEEEVKGLLQLGKVTRVNLKKAKEVTKTPMDADQDSVITLE